jgi:hypothetical protein
VSDALTNLQTALDSLNELASKLENNSERVASAVE